MQKTQRKEMLINSLDCGSAKYSHTAIVIVFDYSQTKRKSNHHTLELY